MSFCTLYSLPSDRSDSSPEPEMNSERLFCDSCGAPLEIPDGVSFVTCQHCRTPLKVQRNQSVHYTQKVSAEAPDLEPPPVVFHENSKQEELEALDRKWSTQRENLLNTDRSVPTEAAASSALFFALTFGILALLVGIVFGFLGFLTGLVIFLVTMGNAKHRANLARDYKNAEEEYYRHRQAIVSGCSINEVAP